MLNLLVQCGVQCIIDDYLMLSSCSSLVSWLGCKCLIVKLLGILNFENQEFEVMWSASHDGESLTDN